MYRGILLAVDLGEVGAQKKAVSTAVDLSRHFGAKLHVLSVVPGFGMSILSQYFPEDFEAKSLAAAAEQLEAFVAEHIPADVVTRNEVAVGTVYEEILRVAQASQCDLIILAAHRPGLSDHLIGPNAGRVVRHGECSVLVVRD